MRVRALIPLKDLANAKSRLSGLLSPSERRSLAQAMVKDVVTVLAGHSKISTITLVSDDAYAAQLASEFSLEHWPEYTLGCRGLNNIIDRSCELLFAKNDQPIIVLHGDLPCLSSEDISEVVDRLEAKTDLVIGCDRHQTGTNILAFYPRSMPKLSFGTDSCARHSASAKAMGIDASVIIRPGIGLDIDEPQDLKLLLDQLRGSGPAQCTQLLVNTALGQRVGKQLGCTGSGAPNQTRVSNNMDDWQSLQSQLLGGVQLNTQQALSLADFADTAALASVASTLRDRGHNNLVTYSRKVFIPLTQLCRDVCHYCTFAQTPKKLEQIYMPVEEVVELCRQGAKQGCQEALFTLGERPELRYSAARRALADMGYSTTLEYVEAVASRVLSETGLLPHINAGCMTGEEIAGLRKVSASMGIMLESASARLCEKGMPHYGSPDKDPARRLETLELAGQAAVPFTSGILIGIGETRGERIESLLALRDVHARYGHLQEVIVQNFRAKPNTLMASSPEPDLNELLWTIAVTRLIFGSAMNIQAPPNLSPGVLGQLIGAGINDWGGVSPLTPDHVNPEAPWPHLDTLARETAATGKFLEQRLTIYPEYAVDGSRWLDKSLRSPVLRHMDGGGFAKRDAWAPGEDKPVPAMEASLLAGSLTAGKVSVELRKIVQRCESQSGLSEADITRLFESRGADFAYIAKRADALRARVSGDEVSYVVTRNINYTNVCTYKCKFCAFSKGSGSEDLRGKPYDIDAREISRRCVEAWERGATEVCMQGGIHPDYTGQTYLDILRTVKAATPGMHVHAFSPLEVWQGAETLGVELAEYFALMRDAGLGTLPGTAAEVLHDEVRDELCADKLNSAKWLEVMEAAHQAGFKTTATIMYGHIDEPRHWARHLLSIRQLQQRTGGFTEFVPLPFVHMEAPIYRRGNSRKGPSFREAILMHAVARLVFHGFIDNIQASWVKMGEQGVQACLNAGVNDLGGTLMNESITRAAGTQHGQEWSPAVMEAQIYGAGRTPRMRDTLYRSVPAERYATSFSGLALSELINQKAGKRQSNKRLQGVEVQTVRLVQSTPRAPVQQVILMAACN